MLHIVHASTSLNELSLKSRVKRFEKNNFFETHFVIFIIYITVVNQKCIYSVICTKNICSVPIVFSNNFTSNL